MDPLPIDCSANFRDDTFSTWIISQAKLKEFFHEEILSLSFTMASPVTKPVLCQFLCPSRWFFGGTAECAMPTHDHARIVFKKLDASSKLFHGARLSTCEIGQRHSQRHGKHPGEKISDISFGRAIKPRFPWNNYCLLLKSLRAGLASDRRSWVNVYLSNASPN